MQISILDFCGKAIATFLRAKSGSKELQISMPVKGLSDGFYTLQVKSQSRKQSLHFTMLH